MDSHRKRVRRFHQAGDFHELTFSCYRRLPLLSDDATRLDLAVSLDRAVASGKWRLIAYVFMPEHVHILVQSVEPTAESACFLKSLKGPFSRRQRLRMEAEGDDRLASLFIRERPGVQVFRFWQEGGGYDRNLRTPRAVMASIAYIHENPVRRGLCAAGHEWRWSSAPGYRGDKAYAAGFPPTVHGPPWDLDEPLPATGRPW